MEQQAWILRSLLVQLERQEEIDEEAPNGFAGEFARLKSQSIKYRTEKTFPSSAGEKHENIKKNRYKDILPFDHSRVKLTFTTAKNDTDYINANFIKGVTGSRAYIATQGPLPHTLVDFLRMLWEYNVQIVVMACREFEMAKKKSERYWPQKLEQPFVCEPFKIYCDSVEDKGDYVTRMLRLTYNNCSRTLMQLHYVNWPDHGVPDAIPPILELLQEMRSYQAHDDIPICIHCSAGCGRTGALCAIDYTWNLLKNEMITPDFRMYDLVQNMRTQRPSLVQTKEQYELVSRTIRLLFYRYLTSADARGRRDEVRVVSCAQSERKSEDPCQDLVLQILEEKRDALPRHSLPLPFPPGTCLGLAGKNMQADKQQCIFTDSANTSQDQHKGSKTSSELERMTNVAPAAEQSMHVKESGDVPSANSPPLPAVSLMVEDPYFNTPASSPSSVEMPVTTTGSNKEWTVNPTTPPLLVIDQIQKTVTPVSGPIKEETAPPLPERTPESYILAVGTEKPDSCERLSVVIPRNAAAEAVREMRGSPTSPAPPLPERTPESYELHVNQVVKPARNLSRIGMSSEWSGNSQQVNGASQNGTKSWVRSKSLKAKMTFTVPVQHLDLAPNVTSNLHPVCPPVDSLAPPVLSHTESSPSQAVADCAPESSVPGTHHSQGKTVPNPQPTETAPRVGVSSEWNGSSEPNKFLAVVMSRSKSVRAKSSQHAEPLTAAWQPAPLPVPVAEAGSAVEQRDLNRRSFLTTETPGSKPESSDEKGFRRSKSLKFFRNKQKAKLTPPPPDQPGAPPAELPWIFKFGFGNRFGKPKGPRNHPESWK